MFHGYRGPNDNLSHMDATSFMELPLWNFLYGTSFIELSLCDFPDCYESKINTSTSNSTKGY